MARLIFAPTVILLAQSEISYPGFHDWAKLHGYDWTEGDTPLTRIHDQLYDHPTLDLLVELAGRFCYRSFTAGRGSDEYIRHVIDEGHTSIFEHATATFIIEGVSRSLSHELVRHRVGFSPSQESQRFVNANDLAFVVPPAMIGNAVLVSDFQNDCDRALEAYSDYQAALGNLPKKQRNEAARALLPNAAETRLVGTFNMRGLRHVIKLRSAPGADAEFRRLASHLLDHARHIAPRIFSDFTD